MLYYIAFLCISWMNFWAKMFPWSSFFSDEHGELFILDSYSTQEALNSNHSLARRLITGITDKPNYTFRPVY